MASSDLLRSLQVSLEIFKLNDRIFDQSGHRPSAMFHMAACYFVDRDLRDRVNLVGRGFEPRTEQYDFFIGPGFDS